MLDQDALWRRCEKAWAGWLESSGHAVTPLGEATGNTSRSQAPLTKVGGHLLRSPDLSAIKGGVTKFWEVKSRNRAWVDRLTGESQHWVDHAAFSDYLQISVRTGTQVEVVLYEAPTATTPGRWLQADVHHLRDVGTLETRRGASGAEVQAWVWPVSSMRHVEGPVVDPQPGEVPMLPDEGEGEPVRPSDLFPVERRLRRSRRPVASSSPADVDEAAAVEVEPVVADAPLPHEWLAQEPALALDVLRRSLGVPHLPRYSVLRIGLDGVDLDSLLGLVRYGVRVFLVSADEPEHSVDPQLLAAYRSPKARLVEWAVVKEAEGCGAWVVDGAGLDNLTTVERAALDAADSGDLNVAQYEVVHAPVSADVVVSAGAGTGKTETMSERILFLLATGAGHTTDDGGAPADLRADEIALITFTRESASEMRHRIARTLLLRQRLCDACALPVLAWMLQLARADITTIHSFAKRILGAGGGGVGFGPDTRVSRRTLDVRDAVQDALSPYLEAMVAKHGSDKVPAAYEWQRHVLAVWEALENNGVDLLDVGGVAGADDVAWGEAPGTGVDRDVFEATTAVVTEAARALKQVLLREQSLPANALVPAATAVLRSAETPPVRAYRYLFVDEFQDTDAGQMELVLDVRERVGARLFVVGDVKQGIYRFRGAEGNAFKELQSRVKDRGLPETLSFLLTRNFRSGEQLLDSMHPKFSAWGAAGLLPYDTSDRLRPRQRTTDTSARLKVERTRDARSFAEDAAALVDSWHARFPGDSIGVLCRENWQAVKVREAVRERDIPCELRVGGSFWSTPAVRELRVLLETVADPDDDAALLELCETRWAGGVLQGGPPAGIALADWGEPLQAPMSWESRFVTLADTGSYGREDLEGLRSRVRLLQGMLATEPLLEWVFEMVRSLQPDAWNQPGLDDETERRRYGRCLDHLLTLLDAQFEDGPLGLERLLGWLRLQVATNRNEDEPDAETSSGVVALTVHKAKGLEFDRVVVPATDRPFGPPRSVSTRTAVLRVPGQGIRLLWRWHLNKKKSYETDYTNVPLSRGVVDWGTDDLDTAREEARLLYVAMTRAREELVLMVDRRARSGAGTPKTWGELLVQGDGHG